MARATFPDTFNLADYFLFARLDEGFEEKVAIRFGARAWRYREVASRTRAFAAALIAADVRRGERVLIALPDSPPFAWVFFGALRAGCVVAMANPDTSLEGLAYLIDYTRATAVVTVPKVAAALREERDGSPASPSSPRLLDEVRRVFVVPDAPTGDDPEAALGLDDDPMFRELASDLAAAPRGRDARRTGRDEPAIWLFTSGSTGEPKASVHAHRDFAFNTEVYAKGTVGYAADDVTVSVPRLFFGYATGTNLMFPFAVGATVGLFSERPTPESLVRAIDLYRATVVTNVPTMLGKLLEHDASMRARGESGLDMSSVRFSLSAGEALPEALLRRWQERFRSDVYDGIGSAEMFHIYASNRPGDVQPGSLGRAVDGYELAILPEDAEGPGAARCAPGEIGVLWVRGDSVSFGYWLDRDKSWKTFHGHACRTGDLFKIDERGYLYFAGRADDLIKVSGLWVAPVEVEECLLEHPAVASAAVIGVERDGLMRTKAFVVVRGGSAASEALASQLQEFVKGRIAKHKYPRLVEFVDDLPKNDRGKVDRRALRAMEAAKGSGARGGEPGERAE